MADSFSCCGIFPYGTGPNILTVHQQWQYLDGSVPLVELVVRDQLYFQVWSDTKRSKLLVELPGDDARALAAWLKEQGFLTIYVPRVLPSALWHAFDGVQLSDDDRPYDPVWIDGMNELTWRGTYGCLRRD